MRRKLPVPAAVPPAPAPVKPEPPLVEPDPPDPPPVVDMLIATALWHRSGRLEIGISTMVVEPPLPTTPAPTPETPSPLLPALPATAGRPRRRPRRRNTP